MRNKMATFSLFNERGFVRDVQSLAEIILLDHSYAKPWSAHPDASKVRPVKTLFLTRDEVENLATVNIQSNDEDEIDVCEPVAPTCSSNVMYDTAKAKTVMAECEKYVSAVSSKKTPDTWEEQISRNGWGSKQGVLFDKVIKVLSNLRLSRLTYEGLPNEPVMRRITTDKATKRMRQILSDAEWDTNLMKWLHSTLVDGLSIPLLACYLDILQTLRAKVPTLVDRMLAQPTSQRRGLAASSEALSLLLKRPWDPAHGLVTQHKQRKLPGTPLLLVVPSGPTTSISAGTSSKRARFWHNQLSVLGKVVPVTMHTSNGGSGVSIGQCLDHIIGAVRIKVLELRSHFPNRPIILLGWSVGALVSCQVALMESVCAVVCLGFPITGLSGVRVGVEDPLLELKTPTLFVIGSHSNLTSQEDVEEMREKMKTDTSLLVVGGADEQLRLTRAKKKQEGLTQSMVDRLIMDEIGEFLGNVLTCMTTNSVHTRNDSSDEVDLRKKKRKRSVSRDLSSEMDRSVGKQAVTSLAKKSTPQKASSQDQGNTMLKIPLGNTMGTLSNMRSLSQPSPAKKPRTSKSKSKPSNPPPSIIHVTGAVPTSVVSSVPQAIPVHHGTLAGFPLQSATVSRQMPLQNSSSAALASGGRGQAFISLTAKSSDSGARVTQTFITIPRGSSPSLMTSTHTGGQTVQYIIKPQSQRHTPVSLSAVNAALSAQSSGAQLPVRTLVSAPVRQTPLSQSPTSSFTSLVNLKGTTVTTQAPSLPPGAIPASNATAAAASPLGKFATSSAPLTSGRPTVTRVGELSQPSTISVLTKDGSKLMVSQAISSAGLKGSYKLISGATLQTVSGGTGQSQVVLGYPVRPSTSGSHLVTQKDSSVQGNVVTSLPVNLAALAGKLPSNSTLSQPSGRVTLVQSTRASTLSSQTVRAIPGQMTSASTNRVINQPGNKVSNPQSLSQIGVPAIVTVAKAGTSQVARVVTSRTPVSHCQSEPANVSGKTGGIHVVSSQVTTKEVPSSNAAPAGVTLKSSTPAPTTASLGSVVRIKDPQASHSAETASSSSSLSGGQHVSKRVSATQVTNEKQDLVVAQSKADEQGGAKSEPGSSS